MSTPNPNLFLNSPAYILDSYANVPGTPECSPREQVTPQEPPEVNVPRRRISRRRCSCCGQTGHNIRTCHDAIVPHAHLQQLLQLIVTRVLQRVPELPTFHVIYQRMYEEFFFYTNSLTAAQVRSEIAHPTRSVIHCYSVLITILNNYEQQHIQPAAILRGADHSKKIVVDLDDSNSFSLNSETVECVICCNESCAVKTGCGHDYCGTCVMSIINENKHKTAAPRCSFCNANFEKFTTSNKLLHKSVSDFINNLN